jgi:exodeoxyribonuclease V gamma subunit
MTEPQRSGLLLLHGNRLELLADAVLAWLAAHPLDALEEETLLVQSNGMAEWLKMAIASAQGVCAATRVELPARFIWRAYRAVLGRGAVPAVSPLDKLPLTWRLMALLPELASQPGFAPVAGFLGRGGLDAHAAARRLQLAQRLADLFDQYQVYRSDWLHDWGQGRDQLRDVLRDGSGRLHPVPPDQAWQPLLWRAALQTLDVEQRRGTRALLQQRFLQALAELPATRWPALPRRIVLFGTTSIPTPTLQAIVALSAHCQVLMAVPNPCRFHWADIIDGRELLRAQRRRQAWRGGRDLSMIALDQMHAHGHPLLAAWGRQARDAVAQLDAFDDAQAPRADYFDDGSGGTQLQQVQAAIRELLPLHEQPRTALQPDDRSIVFHVAHSAQREVEILHDQLLRLFADAPPDAPLNPRDVVVMVPAIDSFAAAIRSVFGQHARGHARFIPWGIADQSERGHHPLLVALEWLLNAPQQRFGASEIRDLLDLPAVARRCGLALDDLPTLVAWVEGAGIRWGLDASQRASLGLGACGAANTWMFGLQRMLLGYATGAMADADGFSSIEPYAEVAGLSAALAGTLAELLQTLTDWWRDAALPRAPAAWGGRLRALLAALFAAADDADRAVLSALDDALSAWLQACETADFADPVELAVVREAWLDALDEPGTARRFKAGGVTFCTLLPLRAIPFEVVCLLGMNDGDYPRRGARSDFDLMAQPGQARPGDRSRRDDDRQLMLDALLSARRVLYLSWAGRSQRDNQAQPPSVLVSQLRDHLAAIWGDAALAARTTEHPLQPFSRRYFEDGPPDDAAGLFTYAAEWRSAHAEPVADASVATGAPPAGAVAAQQTFDIDTLASVLRNPVQAFFRHRLRVRFDAQDAAADDDEAFAATGLDRWQLLDEVLRALRLRADTAAGTLEAEVQQEVQRLQRAGRLPLAGPGRQVQAQLLATLLPMLAHWRRLRAAHPPLQDSLVLRLGEPGSDTWLFDDALQDLRAGAGLPLWISLQAGTLADKGMKTARAKQLLVPWLRCLATAACGQPARGVVIGADAVVEVDPPEPEQALRQLVDLLRACSDGLTGSTPLPTALRTGLAWLRSPDAARQAYELGPRGRSGGEGSEACLARLYPDFASLQAERAFDPASRWLYTPLAAWLEQHTRITALPEHADVWLHGAELGDDA